MPVQVGWYEFDDPKSDINQINEEVQVVFIVMDLDDDHQIMMLDIDYSLDIKGITKSHPRKECWKENSKHSIVYSILRLKHATEEELDNICREIRTQYDFPCGPKIESPPFKLHK